MWPLKNAWPKSNGEEASDNPDSGSFYKINDLSSKTTVSQKTRSKNCSRRKKTEETWKLDARCDSGLDRSIFCSCCLCDLTPSWPAGHCSSPNFTGQQTTMSRAVLVFNGFLNFWSHPSTYTAISECLIGRSKMWARGHAQRSNPACWLFTLDANFCVPHASLSWCLPPFTSRAIQ